MSTETRESKRGIDTMYKDLQEKLVEQAKELKAGQQEIMELTKELKELKEILNK